MARNGRCKGGQGKSELENGGKRREKKMEEKRGREITENCFIRLALFLANYSVTFIIISLWQPLF